LTINTLASGGNSGDVEVNGFGDLLIDQTNILTAQSVKICISETCSDNPDNRTIFPFTLINLSSRGQAGNVAVTSTGSLTFSNSAIQSDTRGGNPAGSITITSPGIVSFNNSQITSNTSSTGQAGSITITASKIRLYGDSDITTFVAQGAGGGGDIKLTADSILAFDDSDILAFAPGGTGGNISLETPAFFGENYRPAPHNTDPRTLDGNNRVDVNAIGAVEGVIIIPDTTFIQNSLTELAENQIDTDSLLASSCIVRRNQPTRGSFTITGSGGLP
jgi:hypothetical protein